MHEPPPGAAKLIVYWPTDRLRGSGVKPIVLVDGQELGALEPLGFIDAIVDPGEVSVALRFSWVDRGVVTDDGTNMFLNAKDGEAVFLRYQIVPGTLIERPKLQLERVSRDVGLRETAATRRVVTP